MDDGIPLKKDAPAVAPAPPPPKPVAPAPRAVDAVEAKRWKPDMFRPIRYTFAFLWGTVTGTLDTMARGANKGFYAGFGLACVAYIGQWLAYGTVMPAIYLLAAPFGGLLAGMALGAVAGVLTGGIKGVSLAYRKEKYADDLAVRAESQAARRQVYTSYRDRAAAERRTEDFNFDRFLQQERRTQESQSWQDRVSGGSQSMGRGY
jgi:hypothetical protein